MIFKVYPVYPFHPLSLSTRLPLCPSFPFLSTNPFTFFLAFLFTHTLTCPTSSLLTPLCLPTPLSYNPTFLFTPSPSALPPLFPPSFPFPPPLQSHSSLLSLTLLSPTSQPPRRANKYLGFFSYIFFPIHSNLARQQYSKCQIGQIAKKNKNSMFFLSFVI